MATYKFAILFFTIAAISMPARAQILPPSIQPVLTRAGVITGSKSDNIRLSAKGTFVATREIPGLCVSADDTPITATSDFAITDSEGTYKIDLLYPAYSTIVFRDRGLCRWSLTSLEVTFQPSVGTSTTIQVTQGKDLPSLEGVSRIEVASDGRAFTAGNLPLFPTYQLPQSDGGFEIDLDIISRASVVGRRSAE